jgi:RNA polymerase sigma-70 factor (ECF subfamily)
MLKTAEDAAATVEAPVQAPPNVVVSPVKHALPARGPDAESRAWVVGLADRAIRGDEARRELHQLLLRAARFEINRRRGSHPHLRGGDFDDLAHQAADDAMLAVLGKLETYRGESRFTTWAYKFALLEAAVKLRRRAWQGREVPIDPEHWAVLAGSEQSPAASAESSELLGSVAEAIETALSPHQREVLVAIAVNGVPIDVMAERLNTTRGALYKTVHDARKKLRARLAADGLDAGAESALEGDDHE